jgi:predicted HicB family RNase H-like nuclease
MRQGEGQMNPTNSDREFSQLIVRVDPEDHRKLKLIASYENESMAELVRGSLDGIVKDRERKKAYRDLFAVGS